MHAFDRKTDGQTDTFLIASPRLHFHAARKNSYLSSTVQVVRVVSRVNTEIGSCSPTVLMSLPGYIILEQRKLSKKCQVRVILCFDGRRWRAWPATECSARNCSAHTALHGLSAFVKLWQQFWITCNSLIHDDLYVILFQVWDNSRRTLHWVLVLHKLRTAPAVRLSHSPPMHWRKEGTDRTW